MTAMYTVAVPWPFQIKLFKFLDSRDSADNQDT